MAELGIRKGWPELGIWETVTEDFSWLQLLSRTWIRSYSSRCMIPSPVSESYSLTSVPGIPLSMSAGFLAYISHEVPPEISFRVLSWISCTEQPGISFRGFTRILQRVVTWISTGVRHGIPVFRFCCSFSWCSSWDLAWIFFRDFSRGFSGLCYWNCFRSSYQIISMEFILEFP